MTSRLRNRYTPEQLDTIIERSSGTLSRVLLRRISNGIRLGIPEARTCHVTHSQQLNRYIATQILGLRGALLWKSEIDGHLAAHPGFAQHHPMQVMMDIELYMMLKPSAAKVINGSGTAPNPDYSIHLSLLEG